MIIGITPKFAAQIILLAMMLFAFFNMVKSDFQPKREGPAPGFSGFIGSVLAFMIMSTLMIFAGAFSEIIKCVVTILMVF